EAEAILKKLIDKNPEVGAPLAGDFFYLDLKRLPEAGEMYSLAQQYTLSLPHAIRYAEVLFLTKQADELQKISAEYRQGNKEILLAGFYMDALYAFLIGNKKQLQQSLSALGSAPLPVLGQSVLLNYGIENENLDMVYRAIKEMNQSGLLPQAASAITAQVTPLLLKHYNAGNIAPVYPIAALILSEHNPDLLLTRIVIMGRNISGELTTTDLSSAMRQFPNDPLLSNIAAGNAIAHGNYREAIRLTSGLAKDNPAGRDLLFLRIIALEGIGELDNAIAEYKALLKQFPDDDGLSKQFLAFAMRHGRTDVLQELAAHPILGSLARAEQYYKRGEIDKAKELWDNHNLAGRLTPDELDDRPLLFQIATRLAATGESTEAIESYRKLLQYMPDNPLILVNLSELYATVGQTDSAMQTAQIARNKYPDIAEVQLCYGLRLFEAKNYNSALSELEPHLKNLRARSAAISSMEMLAGDYYSKGQYVLSEELCNRLLKLAPTNPSAKKYLTKIAEHREQQQ
ncbi:MAG: tetratricopeptide repeat protein, partial [Victivallaceae bacterium]